jgi:hypothetical protein
MDGTFDTVGDSSPTLFSLVANFDPTQPLNPINDPPNSVSAYYLTTTPVLFTLNGITSSSTIPLYVFLEDQGAAYNVAVSLDLSNSMFYVNFAATNPEISPLSPSDTVYQGYNFTGQMLGPPLPLIIPLSSGNLNIYDVLDFTHGGVDPTASLVPEPTTYVLLGISLMVVGYARKRLNKVNPA